VREARHMRLISWIRHRGSEQVHLLYRRAYCCSIVTNSLPLLLKVVESLTRKIVFLFLQYTVESLSMIIYYLSTQFFVVFTCLFADIVLVTGFLLQ
jgi:hypothetical protein